MIAAWRAISSSQRAALLALLALAALVNIDQPYPALAPLHHIPTLALIFSAPWWLRRWPLNDGALLCLVGFFALHSIAARWTYSYVPYDAWAQAVSGTTINELFGWNRNWRKCTLGYELAPAAQGRGLMFEALCTVLDWGFEHMQLHRVEALIHPDNAPSLRLVQRLGFVEEGRLREVARWGGRQHDMLQVALLRTEWQHRPTEAPE